jgi:hypothetical protein
MREGGACVCALETERGSGRGRGRGRERDVGYKSGIKIVGSKKQDTI